MGILRRQLSGKALTAYQELAMDPESPYAIVKQALLEAMGATIEEARRTIWLSKLNIDEGPELVLKKIVRAVNRLKNNLTSPEHAAKDFLGFMVQHFLDETLMMLDNHHTETSHQQIQIIKRLCNSKGFLWEKKNAPKRSLIDAE